MERLNKIEEFVKIINGYDDGYDDGSGYGYGSGDGIKNFNNRKVYKIDHVQTIITNVQGNVAKGFILNSNFTLEPCFIAKGHNMFAHGTTLKKTVEDLRNKMFQNLNIDERIEEFKKEFKNNKKYKGTDFYIWHNRLTGSCEMGRNTFVKNHNLNLEDKFTVKEFIETCENDFGGNIIKKLKEFYK